MKWRTEDFTSFRAKLFTVLRYPNQGSHEGVGGHLNEGNEFHTEF
jgi:hypothetical protein